MNAPLTGRWVAAALVLSSACARADYSFLDSSQGLGLFLNLTLSSQIRFVAVGAECSVWTSENGGLWSGRRSLPGCASGAGLYGITYGAGQWVAVGDATGSNTGCGIWTSPDAKTWAQQTCGTQLAASTSLRSIAFGVLGGKHAFVAGAYVVTPPNFHTQTSSDGVSWTQATPFAGGGAGEYVSGVAIVGGRAYAVQSNAVTSASSADGSSWAALLNNPNSLNGPRYLGEGAATRLIGYSGFSNGAMQYTDDGGATLWGNGGNAAFVDYFTGMARSGTHLVLVADNCNIANSIDNGVAVEPANTGTMQGCSGINWGSIVFDPLTNAFVAAGSAGGATRFARSRTGGIGDWAIIGFSDANTVRAVGVRN